LCGVRSPNAASRYTAEDCQCLQLPLGLSFRSQTRPERDNQLAREHNETDERDGTNSK